MDGTGSADRPDTVLVVDDEEDILQSLQDLFEVALDGARCLTARDGEEALELLRQEPVDLIVSDFKMPGMSGLALLQEARQMAPHVPRVLMTAFPDLDIAIQAINEAGIEKFFTKPLDPDKVIETIQDILERRRTDALAKDAS